MKPTAASMLLLCAGFLLGPSLYPATAQTPRAGDPAMDPAAATQVRVTTRILVVDREAVTRAGLSYAVLGHDRVRVERRGHGSGGAMNVGAFLELIRDRRLVRSESSQQVLVLSGREARVASTDLAVGRHAARTRGPSFGVIPVVRRDGSVLLRLSARQEDAVRYAWGYGVDGSPAAVDTELVARPGAEVIVASSTLTESARRQGLLSWGGSSRERDVLIAVRVEVPGLPGSGQ